MSSSISHVATTSDLSAFAERDNGFRCLGSSINVIVFWDGSWVTGLVASLLRISLTALLLTIFNIFDDDQRLGA